MPWKRKRKEGRSREYKRSYVSEVEKDKRQVKNIRGRNQVGSKGSKRRRKIAMEEEDILKRLENEE